jgi:hypothetical protein
MRVLLRALSLAAALSLANAAFACPTDITHELSKVEPTASLTDIVFLNHEDDNPASSEPVTATWSPSPDWDGVALVPSPVDIDAFHLGARNLVDGEGEPQMMAVASTGSLEKAAEEAPFAPSFALDGYEDR